MATGDRPISTFIDLEPNHAKDPRLRSQYESELRDMLVNEVPQMVSRLADVDAIITLEVGEYIDFMREAVEAFKFGLWRAVVALIGIASESFTDTLYRGLQKVKSSVGKELAKEELFGRDDYIPELRKIAVLFAFGIVEKSVYHRLKQIKKLRDRYIHPQGAAVNPEEDARNIMKLFRGIIKDRFDRNYTIKQGKIVKREP